MGFAQVSVSHEVSPLIKLVGRGDTTVVDAYLSPILRRYVANVAEEMGMDRAAASSSPGGGGSAAQRPGWGERHNDEITPTRRACPATSPLQGEVERSKPRSTSTSA